MEIFFLTTADLFITLETGFVMSILTSLSVWTVLQEQAEKPLRYKQDSGLSATSTNCLFSFQSDRKLLEFHTSFYIQIEAPGESILHVNSFPGYRRKLSNSKTLRNII